MVRPIKLMAEYGCTVLWGVDPSEIGPINPDSLPLTSDLKTAVRRWAEAYDSTLNQDYPQDSGFASQSEKEAFEAEGRRLGKELQAQLGAEYKVIYFSETDRKLCE
jgi:hypothetical protein